MTTEEKREKVFDYCFSHHECTRDCLLNGDHWSRMVTDPYPCLDIAFATENDLDKALELIDNAKPTIEETVDEIEVKRDALQHYCGNNDCETCPLVNHKWANWIVNAHNKKCLNIDGANDYEVLEAYDLICRSYAPNESVNHPKHYNKGTIEVIDYIEDQGLGFHLGNAIKYISRAGDKDPEKIDEDIRKAYLGG